MKLLVVHEVNYAAKIIYEFQILPEILSILGHEVTVVDYDDSWHNSKGATFRFRTEVFAKTHRAYPEAAVTLRRPGMIRLPMVSRVSAAFSTGVELVRLMRQQRFDALLLYGLPTVGLQALCAARAFRIPIFFRSIDILNRLVPFPALRPITKAMEGLVYRRVDGISCVTPHLKDYVQSYGVSPSLVEVLPSGVDVQMFCPGPRNTGLLSKWGIGAEDPVALFMGTIYSFSGLDRVISGFKVVLQRLPRARLMIVGVGEDQARLERMAADSGLEQNVIFTGLQPYAALPDLLRSCDLCINPFELNPITRDILPTKLFQYLACGKPVLMTELPGTLPFLKGPEDGVVYASLDRFNETLADLLSDSKYLTQLGAHALNVARRDYDWTSIANRMIDWIKRHSN